MLIRVVNFMGIENLSLNLNPGFNVITGPSNSGKTSLIKALDAVFYNNNSDTRVKQGKDSYMIGVQEDSKTVMVKRNPKKGTKTVYNVNGENILKVGRNPLQEVEDVFNIKEIEILQQKVRLNFFNQFGYPFLLDRTPSQLYDFLATSDTSNKLNDVIKCMKEDLRDMTDNQKRLEGSLDVVKTSFDREKAMYTNLAGVEDVTKETTDLAGRINKTNRLSSIIETLEVQEGMLKGYDKSLTEITTQEHILKDVESLINTNNSMEQLKLDMKKIALNIKTGRELRATEVKLRNVENTDIKSLEDSYIALTKEESTNLDLKLLINKITTKELEKKSLEKELSIVCTNIDNLEVSLESINEALSLKLVLDRVISKKLILDASTAKLEDINKELEAVNKELSEFKNCPLCGTLL